MRKISAVLFLGLISCTVLPNRGLAEEIRIGATVPLTGDLATYGTLIKDGIELAASELRSEGHDLKVFYEDVPTPGPVALTAVNKLISQDKVQGIAGNFWNPAIPIMAPVIMRNKIPTFHTAAADDLILGAGDYIVSTNTKIKDEAFRLAEYSWNDLHAKTASVLFISTTFGDHYQQHFIERFQQLGGKILFVDKTNLGDSDLKASLLRVRSSNPDVFFAAYFGNNLGITLKQAREVGIQQQILGVYESEDPSVIETAGAASEGLRFFVGQSESATPAVTSFESKFRERFHYPSRILGANAYDATRILVTALAKCHGDSECTKAEIYRVQDYDGASGRFSIDREGAAQKPFVLKSIKDGKFVQLSNR